MFWHLLLAHFLADYPLQPNWMAANKSRASVLVLHVLIHFGTMLLLVGAIRWTIWPFLLLLSSIHFIIDLGKLALNARKPDWVVLPYLIDQILHYLSIAGISFWTSQALGTVVLPFSPQLAILITAYLLVTYVWYISERVISYANLNYRLEMIAQAWPRMLTRALLLSCLLWLIGSRFLGNEQPALLAMIPYVTGRYGRRAIVTDLLVVTGGMVFVLWALP